jgi:hypothetical protein
VVVVVGAAAVADVAVEEDDAGRQLSRRKIK